MKEEAYKKPLQSSILWWRGFGSSYAHKERVNIGNTKKVFGDITPMWGKRFIYTTRFCHYTNSIPLQQINIDLFPNFFENIFSKMKYSLTTYSIFVDCGISNRNFLDTYLAKQGIAQKSRNRDKIFQDVFPFSPSLQAQVSWVI